MHLLPAGLHYKSVQGGCCPQLEEFKQRDQDAFGNARETTEKKREAVRLTDHVGQFVY